MTNDNSDRPSRTSTNFHGIEDDNVRARLYSDMPGEVVVTKDDEIHLFSRDDHEVIEMESAEAVYDVLQYVESIQHEDDAVRNIAAFSGVFKLLASIADNSYLNPNPRSDDNYGGSGAADSATPDITSDTN